MSDRAYFLGSEFEAQLQAYMDHIKQNYVQWSDSKERDICPSVQEIRKEMTQKFVDSVRLERGTKYIKVLSGQSVHSFIVIKADAKFKFGDVLKAASYAAPAKNFRRANVIDGDFSRVSWTGAL